MTETSGKGKRRQGEFLDAAATVFARKGFHGTTTGDIAAELGIKQGSLYYYFRSKEEALEQICLIGVQGFVQHIENVSASAKPFREKISDIVTAHVGALETKRNFVVVFLNQRRHLPHERRREVSAQSLRYVQVIEEILESGVVNGDVAANMDCHLAALSLVGLCNSVAVWKDDKHSATTYRASKTITEIFLGGVGLR